MGYALKHRESVQRSLRRISDELLAEAIRDLAQQGPQRAHHRVRKGCKKIRALLRLVRRPLGATTFAAENRWFRDFARQLSAVRDAQAVIEAWNDVVRAANVGDRLATETDPVSALLVERRERLAAHDPPSPEVLTLQLAEKQRSAPEWKLDRSGFAAVADGLGWAYSRARSTQKTAAAQPTPETLHEWRKRAKDHWYHMRLIDRIWPDELRARTTALENLTDDLGRCHDLDALRRALAELRFDDSVGAEYGRMIDARAETLFQSATARGSHLFAERPKHFTARIERHYVLWKDGPARTRPKNLAGRRDA